MKQQFTEIPRCRQIFHWRGKIRDLRLFLMNPVHSLRSFTESKGTFQAFQSPSETQSRWKNLIEVVLLNFVLVFEVFSA